MMKLNATIIAIFNSCMVLLVVVLGTLVRDTQCHLDRGQLNGQLRTLFHKMFHGERRAQLAIEPPAIKVKRNWMMPVVPAIGSNSLLHRFEQPPFPLLPVFVQTRPQHLLVVGKMQPALDAPPSQLYARPLPLYNIPYYKYPNANRPFNGYLPPTKSVEVEDNGIESKTRPSTAISKQEKPELTITTMVPAAKATPAAAGHAVDAVEDTSEMGTSLEPDVSSHNQINANGMVMMMEQGTAGPAESEAMATTTTAAVDLESAALTTEPTLEQTTAVARVTEAVEEQQDVATTLSQQQQQQEEEQEEGQQPELTATTAVAEQVDEQLAATTTAASVQDARTDAPATESASLANEPTTPSQELGGQEAASDSPVETESSNENDQQFAGYNYPKPAKSFDF